MFCGEDEKLPVATRGLFVMPTAVFFCINLRYRWIRSLRIYYYLEFTLELTKLEPLIAFHTQSRCLAFILPCRIRARSGRPYRSSHSGIFRKYTSYWRNFQDSLQYSCLGMQCSCLKLSKHEANPHPISESF